MSPTSVQQPPLLVACPYAMGIEIASDTVCPLRQRAIQPNRQYN
ncbi:MAG: hypothetical protein ABGZ17_10960 [Planctomycetaceae bacterium]